MPARMPAKTRAARAVVALVLLCAGMVACTNASAKAPNWVPQQSFAGDGGGQVAPQDPQSQAPQSGSTSPTSPGAPSSGAPSSGTDDPNILARGLAAPVGLAMLPDGSALVGERTTGRIVQVQPQPNQPVTVVTTIGGIDASGDGGLMDLALSPTYAEDRLIYAYITTATDNRVVSFTSTGTPSPVLTGIPKGATDNTGRIVFGADGDLYIGTGDAGAPNLAADPASLAGKVLRVNEVGQPVGTSPIFATGLRRVDGLCTSQSGAIFAVESSAGTATADELNLLAPGADFGWPTVKAGSTASVQGAPTGKGGFGDCAVAGAQIYITSTDGTDLLGAPLTGTLSRPSVGTLVSEKLTKYGRLRTVVAASDGALWLTTTNKDGKPGPDDELVLRIVPQLGGADSPV